MTDPNKLLREIRERLQSSYELAKDGFLDLSRKELAHVADRFEELDHALSNGMYYPDAWTRNGKKLNYDE